MEQFVIEEFKKLDSDLNEWMNYMSGLHLKVAKAAEKLVEESYKAENRAVVFPIDIELIAKYLDIDIKKDNLNRQETKRFSRILGIITSQNGQAQVVIDKEVSYKTQRYTLANAVGRFLLNQTKTLLKCSYAIPLIPQSLEEITADGIALFLLLPMKTFKDEFLQYLEACEDRPLDVDAWLEYLGNKTQISQFNLAIGYQQMKQVLCYQRQLDFIKNNFDINKVLEDPYDKIYA